MDPEAIEATFPHGHRLPAPLVDLCEFEQAHGYPISGCFELAQDGMASLAGWFRKEPDAWQHFLTFGNGASGDIYALWLTEGLAPEQAPVVMFGSEGDLVVLACDAEDFCRLLCLGYREVGYHDPASPPDDFDEAEPLRRFMIARRGYSLPATGEGIAAAAAARFPGFEEWVLDRQD
jgi:hypothetical protein